MPSRIYSLVVILCLLIAPAWTQDTKGTISGRVTDPSGSVIPGAQVVVTNTAMGTKSDLIRHGDEIGSHHQCRGHLPGACVVAGYLSNRGRFHRSEEHTSELQSLRHLVCR